MIANVLQAFTFALVPFAIYQLLLRVFYALADTRTPAFMAIFNVAISITLGVIGYKTLPTDKIVMGISIALGVSWTFGCVVAALILRRRLNGLGARTIVTSHVKIAVATIPALLFALAVHLLAYKFFYYHVLSSLGVLAVGGGGAMVVYFLVARLLRIPELESLQRTMMARLPGRGAS
jgi:putative peptidoglycan lipid II flippase